MKSVEEEDPSGETLSVVVLAERPCPPSSSTSPDHKLLNLNVDVLECSRMFYIDVEIDNVAGAGLLCPRYTAQASF